MRNLIVCCDGTWNTAAQTSSGLPDPTNVVRMYNAVADKGDSGVQQLKYYHPGVGTDGNWLDRLKGGAFGEGLDKNIQSAYKWLATVYQPGDRIFLFGFSRGAYTVRSLVGMMSHCGLLDLSAAAPGTDTWKPVIDAYNRGYRGGRQENWGPTHPDAKVHFIGVWDTVGALGVPLEATLLKILVNPAQFQFHDTALSDIVSNARHALAMDEFRADYSPTLWTSVPAGSSAIQMWFPGCHSDIGGGYLERGLGDSTLKWMMDEAVGCGLGLIPAMVDQVQPNFQDVLHDSTAGVMKVARTEPRSVLLVDSTGLALTPNVVNEHPGGAVTAGSAVSQTALARQAMPSIAQCPYRPTKRLAVGQSETVTVYAAEHWNDAGIYLEAGSYEFSAIGEWIDNNSAFDPAGGSQHHFSIGDVIRAAGSALGHAEPAFQALVHDDQADLDGTKRVEDEPWFKLIGVVANGHQIASSKRAIPHQTFGIGKGVKLDIEMPGYLYAFANDVWALYGNNHGSVELTVKRVA